MVEKKFSIKHIFKNCQELRGYTYSLPEEYFGVPWKLCIRKSGNQLGAYLRCMKTSSRTRPWSVDGFYKMCLLSSGEEGHHKRESFHFAEEFQLGWDNYCSWDDVVKHYLKDDSITVVCHVTIKRMSGFATKRKISFEKHEEHLSDMVLNVGSQKFNINKSLLAFRSPYFKALFFGKFTESKSSEVELKDVDPEFFQNLLDAIYGEPSVVQAENVERLLELADQFDVAMVRDRCEELLMQTDEIENRAKLRLADKYDLKKLMTQCLESMESMAEIMNNTPSDLDGLNHSTVVALLRKSFNLHGA